MAKTYLFVRRFYHEHQNYPSRSVAETRLYPSVTHSLFLQLSKEAVCMAG